MEIFRFGRAAFFVIDQDISTDIRLPKQEIKKGKLRAHLAARRGPVHYGAGAGRLLRGL